jgi:hypothetical protein
MFNLLKKLSIALFVLLPACSNSNEGACERIAEACHDKDTGSGAAHDCHVSVEAESATDESCAAQEDDCLAACNP